MTIRGLILIAVLMLLVGCGTVQVDMRPYYSPGGCAVRVTDKRPDVTVIMGYGATFEISPPAGEVLYSKLCGNGAIRKYAEIRPLHVTVTELRVDKYGFEGADRIMAVVGSVESGGLGHEITAYGVAGFGGLASTVFPPLLNSALDDFVKQVALRLSLQD
jgi:hypothetical protein